MLVNPYTSGLNLKNFPTLYKELVTHYDYFYDTVPGDEFELITPRYLAEHGLKIGFKDIFYYINLLYDNNPKSVIDVGCGECIWKKWFPNIIGFDPAPSIWSTADFVDFFDEDFSQNYASSYDSGMALNSLHFINWDCIPKQIDLAMNLVNDRFLFTFNFNLIKVKPTDNIPKLILLFDDVLKSSNYQIELLDYPFLRGIANDGANFWPYAQVNGHVRFILSHNNKDVK
jgi:hypothetical protein